MDLYKVKIKPEVLAEASHPNNVDGYLSMRRQILVYTRGEAIKKAKAFRGSIEKLIEPFDSTKYNDFGVIQGAKDEGNKELLTEIEPTLIHIRDTIEKGNYIHKNSPIHNKIKRLVEQLKS